MSINKTKAKKQMNRKRQVKSNSAEVFLMVKGIRYGIHADLIHGVYSNRQMVKILGGSLLKKFDELFPEGKEPSEYVKRGGS